MKKIYLLIFAVALFVHGSAQQYLYTPPTEISNIYPFASNSNNLRQSIYYPSNFPTAPLGNITAIYLKAPAAVTPNVTNLTIKMGSTTISTFPNSSYMSGLQTVYSGSYNQPSITGNYIKIGLQTPFPYDPTQNFIVELSQSGYSAGFSIMQGSVDLTARTLFGNSGNTSGTVQARLPTMGFDLDVAMAATEVHNANGIQIYPNPVSDLLHFTKVEDGATYSLQDPAGRLISKGEISGQKTIDVSALRAGIYFISVTVKGETVLKSKFIKK